MKTVCQLIDYGGKTGSSFTDGLARLSSAVRNEGDRFVVVATTVPDSTWGEALESAGAEVHYIRDTREAHALLRQLRPDIVHTHFTTYDVTAAMSAAARVFWHVHSVREERSPLWELRAQVKYRLIGMKVAQWLCVSAGIRDEVVQRGAPANRVRVVSNGIDTERFRPPSAEERAEARRAFGIRPDDRVLLFFDRTPIKGGAVLRDALAQRRDVRLLVNGGPDEDWSAFSSEHDVIRAPRMADPRPMYWAADAFVLPSLGEGFAFVLAEAAACGLRVAASDIPPAVEMLGGCSGAFIFPRGDAQRLADAIDAALSYRGQLGGRARIVDVFSLERWTHDLVRIYNS